MIETTINELETTIGQIRNTINEGIQNRSDLTENDKLKDDAPLVDYIDAITKLQSSITSTDQQIIVLYTYAKDKAAADSKHKPTISWAENENKEYNIEYGEFDPFGWVPTEPSRPQDITEKLWIRFASIIKGDTEATFGIPIQMTGDQGPKGDQGIPGTDAVILTAVHRLVKLYCESDTKPTVPAFRKDTSSNSKFKNDLDVTRIYYGDETNPTYIDEGDWTSEYTGGPNEVVWEIDVDINSKGNEVKILSTPIRKHITVTSTKVKYAANNSDVSAPTSGWVDSRPSMKDNSQLWSKTITTYSNGYTHEYTSLIQELPTVIKSITTTYLATQDTTPPDENAEGWSSDIPMIGPVIWKKEVTEYTANIERGDSNIKTITTPVAIQGASGIKFIGTVTSESDLPTEALVWDEEYIGRMGMLVGADTYIWYGTSEPTPAIEGIKRIGSNYWLDMGPIHVCDWDASEGELGYVRNRTHYKTNNDIDEVQIWKSSITSKGTSSSYFIFDWDCDIKLEYIPVLLRHSSTGETKTVNCYSEKTWIDPLDHGKGYITGDFRKGYGEVCLDPIGWSFVDIAQQSEIGYGYTETVTRIPEEYVSTNHDVFLSELFVLIINKKLIPGHTYTFNYDNYKLHATAITSDKLSPELQCSSDSVSSIVVSWHNSGFQSLMTLSSVTFEDTFVNVSNGVVLVLNTGIVYKYNTGSNEWTTPSGVLNYGYPHLDIIKYKDYNCNEWVNPQCTFDQYSKYNTIKGDVKVTCVNSSNNIVQGKVGVVNINLSNNNTITMHLSGTLNVSESDSNIIFGQVASGESKKVSEELNCIIYADDNLSRSDESNEIIGFNVVANTIDVSGKIYAARGFYKQ